MRDAPDFYMAARRLEEARGIRCAPGGLPHAPNVHYAYGVFLMNQDADAALKSSPRVWRFHRRTTVDGSVAFEYMKRDELDHRRCHSHERSRATSAQHVSSPERARAEFCFWTLAGRASDQGA